MNLHLGCDKRYIPDFVHVDLADFSHIDHRHDVRTLPMFTDHAADLIYACHIIEYFDRSEVLNVLQEWHRVIKPGGILRLAMPDFAALAEIYTKHQDLSLIHGPLYGRWEIPAAQETYVTYHHTVYDFEALQAVLCTAGFENVQRYDWRQTLHKDYDDYSQAYIPHMDKENGTLISLNVEAQAAKGIS